jgi:hypothetical protein
MAKNPELRRKVSDLIGELRAQGLSNTQAILEAKRRLGVQPKATKGWDKSRVKLARFWR